MEGLNDELDIFGQQPGLGIYTQLCLCYSVGHDFSDSAIINTLTNGLERLATSFPWIAGQVVNEGAGEGSSGSFKIKPLERTPRLVVRDFRHDPAIPTMDALRRASFPSSMLDESIIAPRRTLPGSPDEAALDTAPVFLVQATFITGGLLLTFVGRHDAMDMAGQGQMMHLLSKACRNEQFTSEELASGNLVRRNLVPLLDDSDMQGSNLAHQIVKPGSSHPISNDLLPPPPLSPPKCSWAYFIFDPSSVAALKSFATETITLQSGYISTDDAITAFIWQSVIRARLHRLNPAADSTLGRAVNGRSYLGIPGTYPGVVVNMTYNTSTLQKAAEEPLGGIASQLRLAVDPKTSKLGYDTRALATLLNRSRDKSTISVTATLNLSADLAISSWAKQDCYNLDFDLGLGKPEAVRRPQFTPVESLIYLMPRKPDGEIAVMICLRDEDMEKLRADKEFAKHAKYIG